MLNEILKLYALHLTNFDHIIMCFLHRFVELSAGNSQIGVQEDGVDVVNNLSADPKLGVILVKVSVNLINVVIFTNCIICELMQIFPPKHLTCN